MFGFKNLSGRAMCSLHDLLQHVFIIILPGAPLAPRTLALFRDKGINATLWPAHSKEYLDLSYLQQAARPALQRTGRGNLTVKAFATAMSHRSLYHYIAMNELPCALVTLRLEPSTAAAVATLACTARCLLCRALS